MKSLRSFVLASLAVMMLAGCGGSSAETAADTETAAPETTETSETASAASAAPAEGQDMGYRSTWDGTTCTSYWNNLTFTLPEGWVQLTDDQIAQLTGSATDPAQGVYSDFYIQNEPGTATFSSQIVDLDAMGTPEMTLEEYLANARKTMEAMTDVNAVCDDPVDATLGNLQGKAMGISLKDSSGQTLVIETMFVTKNDNVIVTYVSAAKDQDAAAALQEFMGTLS